MALIKCPECEKEVSDKAEACPNCGFRVGAAAEKKSKTATFLGCGGVVWLLLIGTVFLIFIIGKVSSSNGTASAPSQPTQTKNAERDLQLRNHKWVNEEYSSFISGVVENISPHEYEYAQIQFNFYDRNGNQVNSSLDNINNLEPNRKWKFKVPVLGREQVKSYKFKQITGF